MLTVANVERFAPFMMGKVPATVMRVAQQYYGPNGELTVADDGGGGGSGFDILSLFQPPWGQFTGAVTSETDQRAWEEIALASRERVDADYREFGNGLRWTAIGDGRTPETTPGAAVPLAPEIPRRSLPAALTAAQDARGGAGRTTGEFRRTSPTGGVFCSHVTYEPTRGNLHLERVKRVWEMVYAAGGVSALRCDPSNPNTCGREPWIEMPAGAQRFQKTGSIPRPVLEGVEYNVLTFRVPNAMDGVLITITNQWDGAGFVDGNGDLIWRWKYDNQWFQDLDDVRIILGRLENPYELEGAGYRLLSGQTISVSVELGAGALARLDPDGRVTVAASGWFYPRD
jgi:hypothetical protein